MAMCMIAMPRAFGGGSIRFSIAIASALAFQLEDDIGVRAEGGKDDGALPGRASD